MDFGVERLSEQSGEPGAWGELSCPQTGLQRSGHAEEVICPKFQRASGQAGVPSTPGPSALGGLGIETWIHMLTDSGLKKPLRRNSVTDPSSLGHLCPPTHTHLGCPARRVSSELSPAWMAGRHGDMDSKAISSEEVGLESGCRQTGLDFAISSMVGICLGQFRTWVETIQL